MSKLPVISGQDAIRAYFVPAIKLTAKPARTSSYETRIRHFGASAFPIIANSEKERFAESSAKRA